MFNSEFETIANLEQTARLDALYRQDEEQLVNEILEKAAISNTDMRSIQEKAIQLVTELRKQRTTKGGLDAFMFQYDLSSEEGIALMCLAEALLRIPDKENIDKLIRDKLVTANWSAHLGKSHSLFVNAATWALMLTGKMISQPHQESFAEHGQGLTSALKKLAAKGGEPIVRQAISQAMKILGKQFVMGRSIQEALKRARDKEAMGYRYSYDMLGEAAFTAEDAKRYLDAYVRAIEAIGEESAGKGPFAGPGISIKLSALHPRYELSKTKRVETELLASMNKLILLAKEKNIGLTIDAEESYRLMPSLRLLEKILASGIAKGWDGLGLAVQAYQKRALAVIDHLKALSDTYQQKLCVRLVKGAYWDTEIKLTQMQGLEDYPVFTRKVTTDVNYIACVKKLCDYKNSFFLQFATHNALTVSIVEHLCKQNNVEHYEYQCLHGMGDPLYDQIVSQKPCRVYAPVGSHEDLLAYLVRRLLENGANSSFVNRIANDELPLESIIQSPMEKLKSYSRKRHPNIPLPKDLFGEQRLNSKGLDLAQPKVFFPVLKEIEQLSKKMHFAQPTFQDQKNPAASKCYSPIDTKHCLGEVVQATPENIALAIDKADEAYQKWRFSDASMRSRLLNQTADLLEANRTELLALLMFEGGKVLDDAVSEVREAVDFCRYYAQEALKHHQATTLTGPTGELNQLSLHGRGIIACISPWNFPLAIFLGQVTAALASGNCVIAKPAAQTTLVAQRAIDFLHQAGFAKAVVQLLPTSGRLVSEHLLKDIRIRGVLFTGSTETARSINQLLANRPGPIVPFVAETGGQNAMIVDSSALAEQVVSDVITSAFKSAGQRCSALRVLFVQEDIADKILTMLKGATQELVVGNPLDFTTDIGPVISNSAKDELLTHVAKMDKFGKKICEATLSDDHMGCYFAPRAYEIENIDVLENEVFGPVLHVIRFKGRDLDKVIQAINKTGFGLTLGIHSRIDETINYIIARVNVGNIYVNRNMIGAVVGVQPFGGEGLSGTGPKAGGPHYLIRLSTERTLSVNTTASGGNASLMSLCDNDS